MRDSNSSILILSLQGHWSYFKAGWLHRDVSIENVLVVPLEKHRKPPVE